MHPLLANSCCLLISCAALRCFIWRTFIDCSSLTIMLYWMKRVKSCLMYCPQTLRLTTSILVPFFPWLLLFISFNGHIENCMIRSWLCLIFFFLMKEEVLCCRSIPAHSIWLIQHLDIDISNVILSYWEWQICWTRAQGVPWKTTASLTLLMTDFCPETKMLIVPF